MRVIGAGHLLFALGLAGLGVLSLVSGDFALNWQPVPAWVPWRETLAYASGILLLAGGIGMLVERTAAPCALVMATYMLSWVLVLQVPRAAAAPGNVGMWLGVSESTVLMTGGWMVFASLARPADQLRMRFVTGSGGARVARLLFGAACLVLGLSHFVYADGTASMVPALAPRPDGLCVLDGRGAFRCGSWYPLRGPPPAGGDHGGHHDQFVRPSGSHSGRGCGAYQPAAMDDAVRGVGAGGRGLGHRKIAAGRVMGLGPKLCASHIHLRTESEPVLLNKK